MADFEKQIEDKNLSSKYQIDGAMVSQFKKLQNRIIIKLIGSGSQYLRLPVDIRIN